LKKEKERKKEKKKEEETRRSGEAKRNMEREKLFLLRNSSSLVLPPSTLSLYLSGFGF